MRSDPFTEEVKSIWRERFGVKQVGGNGYGLTQAAVITSLAGGEHAAPGASGKRIPDFDVPAGTSGEIVVRPLRPDIMFMGYWRRPEDTLKPMLDLWLHTGDIGKFDEQGFFYFVDRKKDYLRRRGESISSFEMETAFARHPALAEVAVHAGPSDKREDDVKVTAMLRPGMAWKPGDLFQWAIGAVPCYALPRYIEFRDNLCPRSPRDGF